MERISEAGILYLNDYQILTEARKEVERFLDSIIDEVYNILTNDKQSFDSNNFSMHIWKNQSSRGYMEVQFKNLRDGNLFRKDKVDLYIIYKDIRISDDIHPNSVEITVWSPNVASVLEDVLKRISTEKLGFDIYKPTIVEFDFNNSIASAEKIAREIFNKTDLIEKLVGEILIKDN